MKLPQATSCKPGDTLVFSVAVNGYHWRYRRLLRTQKQYADRHGYTHVVIDRPLFSMLGNETAWLKLSVALRALESGYQRVFYIDADAEVRETTPALEAIVEADKSIYAARGYSDRINSGVLLFVNTPASRAFLDKVIDNIDTPLPLEDDVGWGENGHIIHFLRNEAAFCELPASWNNNHSPDLNDYIRHYSAGPLREYYSPAWQDRVAFIGLSWPARLLRAIHRLASPAPQVSSVLPILTARTVKRFRNLQYRV
ncbi:hypothetical protein [Zhongshania borealis]|uniref:Nucleotide-diphospho-sugar transferase domain-containing protein n=1 Tax=Zhongshania borealis TaxID=889488 RepID=A0ABP7X561_9GAMM